MQHLFGPAQRRRSVEIELPVLEVGHLREPPAERVETHDVRVHLAEPQSERVDVLLHRAPSGIELGFLGLEARLPFGHLGRRIGEAGNAAGAVAAVERAAGNRGERRRERETRAGGAQSELREMSAML